MTTIAELREALAHDADVAADPARIAAVRGRVLDHAAVRVDDAPIVIDTGVRRRARRLRPLTVGLAGIAAAAVAALVVTLFVANRPGAGDAPAATVPAAVLPLDTWGFTVDPDPGGLVFADAGSAAGVQGGFWQRPGETGLTGAALTVAATPAAGQIPARPAGATSVTVGDSTGWSTPWDDTMGLYYAIGAPGTLTVWQDASGLWAALVAVGVDSARAGDLAASVHLADYRPVRVPLVASWVPPGSEPTAVGLGDRGLQLVFGPHASQFQLGVTPAGSARRQTVTGTATPQPVVVGAFHGTYRADDPVTELTDGRVDVAVTQGDPAQFEQGLTRAMPLDTLARLVRGLTVADLDDPASWTDLAAALPSS